MKIDFSSFLLFLALICFLDRQAGAMEIYVSPTGNDQHPGTFSHPLASLPAAQKLADEAPKGQPVTVFLRGGEYRLGQPLIFSSADSGTATAPVIYQAYAQEKPVIGSGLPLSTPHWAPYQNGIMQTTVPESWETDQLFINGELQTLARYPNYDANIANFNGFSADALSPERIAHWSDPTGGFIHVLHGFRWGGLSYRILGKNPDGTLKYEGGWQTNRPAAMDKKVLFVENIFEELDAPGEWFLNKTTHTLYFYPPAGFDLNHASVEGVRLPNLIEFRGTDKAPVCFVRLKGLTFTQAARTFMDTKEPLLRTDWAICRNGAILFNGSEDCGVIDCLLSQLGGNAIFFNDYNRRATVQGCHITKIGASGVSFIGDTASVRSPLINYNKRQNYADINKTPGPQSDNYPADCLVDDCLIHDTGTVEKQSAPVNIDIAQSITVSHCSIYHCPRAGINIGDGCFGGHLIEFCDVFDTVRETGDHGSFNAWGRDRWWGIGGVDLKKDIVDKYPDLPTLDCVKPITLTNSRWRCDHGWDIDLDDGSTNYIITNNLCLNGGIKNREGFYRHVENNIMVNAPFCPHVWYADSGDVVIHNILARYAPAGMKVHPWGKEMDYNFFTRNGQEEVKPATAAQLASGGDAHSVEADAQFVDPASGNFQVGPNSPALAIGFKNFPMNQFGVQKPELKALAETPKLPVAGEAAKSNERDQTPLDWNGAKVRNIKDEGEMSVYGLSGVTGVLITGLNATSDLATAGAKTNDVILQLNGQTVVSIEDLKKNPTLNKPFTVLIFRDQSSQALISK